jgi:hypothetical protein
MFNNNPTHGAHPQDAKAWSGKQKTQLFTTCIHSMPTLSTPNLTLRSKKRSTELGTCQKKTISNLRSSCKFKQKKRHTPKPKQMQAKDGVKTGDSIDITSEIITRISQLKQS